MTLKQIEYYMSVCQAGNFSAAAAELYISRTVLSRAMRDLEQELKLPLFMRGPKGLELTEDGQRLRSLFSQFSGVVATLQDRIDALKQKEGHRTLRVGVAVSCGSRFYPELYERFRETFPDIHLRVRELSSYDAYQMLCDGSLDVILTPISLEQRDTQLNALAHLDLYPSEIVICVSRCSPLAERSALPYRDIQSLPMAALNSRLPIDRALHVVLRTSRQDLLHRVVADGALCAILPRELTDGWDDVACVPLNPPMVSTVKAIWNETLPQSSALRDLCGFLARWTFQG